MNFDCVRQRPRIALEEGHEETDEGAREDTTKERTPTPEAAGTRCGRVHLEREERSLGVEFKKKCELNTSTISIPRIVIE